METKLGDSNFQRQIEKKMLLLYEKENDLIFDKEDLSVLYKSERLKQRENGRAKYKFDLYSAIREGIPIDESGLGTCGVGV